MKRFLIVAFTLLWGVSALAGEPFFCTKAGSKLYYERYKTKTNKMIQTTEFEVDSLVNAGKGKRSLFGGRASLVTTLDNYLENWYVPNKGYVRHDVYSLDKDLLQSEVLQKIL